MVQIGSTTFEYDNNGNLKKKTDGSLITTYDYDHENRLMSVHLPTTPPKTIHYKYDALGRRIERTDANTATGNVTPMMAGKCVQKNTATVIG